MDKFNASGSKGRDCPICFRRDTLSGLREGDAPRLTCTGCHTSFILTWSADPRIADVILYRRPADSAVWQRALSLGKVAEVTLPSVTTDDWFFAVATADAAGNQSIAQAPSAVGR